MQKLIVLLTVLAVTSAASASHDDFRGPKCLGPFCLGMTVYPRSLFEQLGSPKMRADAYCFQSDRDHLFLCITTEEALKGAVVSVFLSDFSNCLHHPQQITHADLTAWKTREGIGIGSTEEDVLKAFGKPLDRWKATPDQILGLMEETRKGDKPPIAGQSVEWMLAYGSTNKDELRFASIGLRNGKVSYVWLSESE
jgi:hypothetical protein